MRLKLRRMCLLAPWTLGACTAARPIEAESVPVAVEQGVAPSGGASSPRPIPREATRVPMTLKVEGPSGTPAPGTRIDLTARISRIGRWAGAVELRVGLPPGATLVEGAETTTIEDKGPGESETRFVIATGAQTPTEDVKFTASLRGAGYGVTAHGAYRFGRPEPALSAVPGHVIQGLPANSVRLPAPPPVNGIRPPVALPMPPPPARP